MIGTSDSPSSPWSGGQVSRWIVIVLESSTFFRCVGFAGYCLLGDCDQW